MSDDRTAKSGQGTTDGRVSVDDVDTLLAHCTTDRADGGQGLVRQRDECIEGVQVVAGQGCLEPIGERQQVAELRRGGNVCTYRRNDSTAECLGDVEHRS